MSNYEDEDDEDIDLSDVEADDPDIDDARALRAADATTIGRRIPQDDDDEGGDDPGDRDEDGEDDEYDEEFDEEEDEDEDIDDDEDIEDEDYEDEEDIDDDESLSEYRRSQPRTERSSSSRSPDSRSQSSLAQTSRALPDAVEVVIPDDSRKPVSRPPSAPKKPQSSKGKRAPGRAGTKRNALVVQWPPTPTIDSLVRVEEGETTEMWLMRKQICSALANAPQLHLNIVAAVHLGSLLMCKIRYGTTYPEEIENLINDVLKRL